MSTFQGRSNLNQCFVYSVKLMILVVFCVHFIGIEGQAQQGEVCYLPGGGQGRCQDQTLCPALLTGSDDEPVICNYRRNKRIICCQDYDSQPSRGSGRNDNFANYDYESSFENTPQVNSERPWWNQPEGNRPFAPTTVAPWWQTKSTTRRFDERPVWGDNSQENRPTTQRPTARPTARPTVRPTARPTARPTTRPTMRPTSRPAQKPNSEAPFNGVANRISKAEQMCKDYGKLLQLTVSAVALTPNPEPVHHSIEKCDFNGLPLIVGGTKSGMGEFPHMAAVGYRDDKTRKIVYDCGGSLISEFFVMTAAHCCTTRLPVEVRLGAWNITAVYEPSSPVNYRVIQILRHPEHKATARYNDIALLRLAEKVKFSKFIRPACIYTKNPVEGNKAIAIGWGKIDFAEDKSDLLLKVHINIIDSNTCNQLYNYDRKTGKLRDGIVPSMMCAGDLKGGKDTCQGDSGGPLQVASSKNQCLFSIIGVTSFGKFCAAENSPGVYTRVSHFVPWIESVVWP